MYLTPSDLYKGTHKIKLPVFLGSPLSETVTTETLTSLLKRQVLCTRISNQTEKTPRLPLFLRFNKRVSITPGSTSLF